MNWIHAVLLGIIEGITEFLPISSTFHLVVSGELLGIPQTEFLKVFDVAIQAGAIAAVGVLYWDWLFTKREALLKVIVSFIPTAILGFLLRDLIKGVIFESLPFLIAVFAVVGVGFIWFEAWQKKRHREDDRDLQSMSWKEAVIVGVAQAAAMVPGVSRAGAVMVALMALKFKRDQAAEYSFILAVPTIGAAAALDILSLLSDGGLAQNEWSLLGIGFGVSAVVAFFVLRWLIAYLQRHTLELFGWYRLGAAALLVIWMIVQQM